MDITPVNLIRAYGVGTTDLKLSGLAKTMVIPKTPTNAELRRLIIGKISKVYSEYHLYFQSIDFYTDMTGGSAILKHVEIGDDLCAIEFRIESGLNIDGVIYRIEPVTITDK